ncbi:hypothetical protein [Devosia sp.]|uniref:hypothetical protein n=1 Tax=Devosia sp. TaxID=1871048 RepID=UPI002735F036|nr:hypothetical protein [Devosia sp.]MDP2782132.1 hypothetical protein [Devosia sp.]
MNAEMLWHLIVNCAPAAGRLVVITDIVARLATRFEATGHLPDLFPVNLARGGASGPELMVHAVGEIGGKLMVLADLLADPKLAGQFHVAASNVVDVQPEDIASGRIAPPKAGLLLSYDGMPVLVIGGEAERLVLKMENFDRALIGLTAELPGLWERVRRAEGKVAEKTQAAEAKGRGRTREGQRRHEGARQRVKLQERQECIGPTGQLGLTLPAATFLPTPMVGGVGPVSGDDLLLVPIQGRKETPGAYPPRKIVDRLRAGLAVQAILADCGLRALLGDRTRARDELQKALPRTGAHLRDIGTGHLVVWTEFDNVEQVEHWAKAKYAGHPKIRNLNAIPLDGELAPVKILSRALAHAERIVVAYDRAEREPPELAAIIIREAYAESPHTNLGLDDLFQIAMLGNINPLTFWSRSHDDHALAFEAARIAGRVQAGARVMVPPHIQDVFREVLTDGPSRDHPDSDASIVVALRRLAQAMADLIGPDKLLRALSDAAGTDQHLVVARKTRKVSVISND